MSSLKPDESHHSFLLSSTSRFVGEYESDDLLLTHAWPQLADSAKMAAGMQENPYSRNYYMLVAKIPVEPPPNPQQGLRPIPDYSHLGELFCSCLSVLFGKRFDNHGMIQGSGRFHSPFQGLHPPTPYPHLGPNSHQPRKDLGIPLNLVEFGRITPLFRRQDLDEKAETIFAAASRFYLRSLRSFDADPEAAVLDLVTCGELLSGYYEYPEDALCDDTSRHVLETIEKGLPNGRTVVKALKGRLRQIKRRYVLSILQLLKDEFFAGTEARQPFASLQRDKIEKRIAASYDLRSLYVHTGVRFGGWMKPHGAIMNETMLGTPVIDDDKRLAKVLALVPTYPGLERLMRYCLLRFQHLHLAPVAPALDGPGLDLA